MKAKSIKDFIFNRYVLFGLVAVLFITVFSSLSPLISDKQFAGDSVMFEVIGKYWAKGSVPYADIWDSKGPLIFFVNALVIF